MPLDPELFNIVFVSIKPSTSCDGFESQANRSNYLSKSKYILRFFNSSLIDRYGYHIGLAAFFLHIVVLLLLHAFSFRPSVLLILALQAIGVFMLGGVVTIKITKYLLANRKSRPLKWVLGITNTLLVGALSLVGSKEIINAFTGTDASHFTVSMKIFPLLLSPAAWLILIGGAAFLYAIVLIMKLNALSMAGFLTGGIIEPPPLLPSMGKVFGAASIFFIALVSTTALISQVRMLVPLLVRFDYVSRSECSNRQPGELVKDLHNGRISVAMPRHDGSYGFEIRPCELSSR